MHRDGPSPEAIERLDRVLLCLFDAGKPLRSRECIERLSEPMSRSDFDSAIRRLRGGGMIAFADGEDGAAFRVLSKGVVMAQRLIDKGKSY